MVPPIKFGCQIITYGDINKTIQYAILVEKAGFDAVSLPDHLFHPLDERFLKDPPWDAFTLLTAVGLNTKRVKMMPGVADVLRRHPATVAHIISTLDQLTGGRAMLALGAGEAFNLSSTPDIKWDKPVSILEEAVKVMKLLWKSTRDGPASFNGKHFQLKDAFLSFKPVQPPGPPIYVGGYGPRIRRLVGEIGDGWIPWIDAPETYKKTVNDIENHAKKAGRTMNEIDTAVMVFTSVSIDGDRAKQIITPRTKVSLTTRARLLRELGYDELAREAMDMWKVAFTKEQLNRIYSLADKIPSEVVEKVTVAGTPDEAINKIEEYVKAGVKFLVTIPFPINFEETINFYEKTIIPYFREKC